MTTDTTTGTRWMPAATASATAAAIASAQPVRCRIARMASASPPKATRRPNVSALKVLRSPVTSLSRNTRFAITRTGTRGASRRRPSSRPRDHSAAASPTDPTQSMAAIPGNGSLPIMNVTPAVSALRTTLFVLGTSIRPYWSTDEGSRPASAISTPSAQ